jgi:hypothetical protein
VRDEDRLQLVEEALSVLVAAPMPMAVPMSRLTMVVTVAVIRLTLPVAVSRFTVVVLMAVIRTVVAMVVVPVGLVHQLRLSALAAVGRSRSLL